MKPQTNIWNLAGMLFLVIVLAMASASLYVHPEKQRDFACFYTADTAFIHGQNPYNTPELQPVVSVEIAPYVYPPYTLYFFRPFTWFDYPTAAKLFLTLKLLAVAGLVYIWHRLLNLDQYYGLFWFLIPLAFSSALIADLRAGNISVFEELLIWAGFYFYIQKKTVLFGIAILLTAMFKLTPVLLLGLLAAKWKKKEMLCGALCVVAFIALLAVSAEAWPQLFMDFLRNVRTLGGERGVYDPSTWALLNDMARWIQIKTDCQLPVIVPLVIYAGIVAVALGVSILLFQRLKPMDSRVADLWRICLLCFAYAIIVPRLKNYSYILLIAPTFFVLTSCKWMNPVLPLGALLAVYSYRNFQFLGTALEPFYRVEGEYYCLILAWMLWGLCCYGALRATKPQTNEIRNASHD